MVIFSVFLYKNYRNQENVYKTAINNFLKRKLININIEVEVGPKYSIEEQRESILEKLFNNDEIERLNLIVVRYKTPLKDVNMQINLNNEDKYEDYLYL
jgi:archaellum biogenesis ATPase FlaH